MNNPEKSRHIDIEKELRRMQGVDLLSTPKKGLSLQDRLRRNRQVEATVWNQVTLPGFDRTKTQPSPTREEETVIPRPNKARWITLPIFTADRRTLIRELLDKPSTDSKETIRKRRREEMDKKTIQLIHIATEALADASEILSDRDIDIFNAVQKGASNADLAELYGRTEAAMEWIVGRIRKKN